MTGSENGVEFRLDQIAGKYDLTDDTQRIAYAQEVSEELAKLENAVEREVYTTRAAQAAGLTPEAMRLEVERTLRRKLGKERKALRRRELNPAVSVQPQERGIARASNSGRTPISISAGWQRQRMTCSAAPTFATQWRRKGCCACC